MSERLAAEALVAGYERLRAWSDLLDRINVFPVADGDTGRNLVISLSPFRSATPPLWELRSKVIATACGNSGNIAAAFFFEFLMGCGNGHLADAASRGRDKARTSVQRPVRGTMLTVFDALASGLGKGAPPLENVDGLLDDLAAAVHTSKDHLPVLRKAGVVDAGALAMFIFWEGFLMRLSGTWKKAVPIPRRFPSGLAVAPEFTAHGETGHCLSFMIQSDGAAQTVRKRLSAVGESLVVSGSDDGVSVHMHARDPEAVRKIAETAGPIVRWSREPIQADFGAAARPEKTAAVHIATDAAGSLTREDAAGLGITLLDSYVLTPEKSLPETLWEPADIYDLMTRGVRVTTSQASNHERHQWYESLTAMHPNLLYLAVGSVYTGNFAIAEEWRKNHDPEHKFRVMDTGAASGRLAVIAWATAEFARRAAGMAEVRVFAAAAMACSREYLFLDRLRYLAAGGRLSKPKAMLGDLVGMKPVITPTAAGAEKIGTARSREEQIAFAMERLEADFSNGAPESILLEFSNNRAFVETVAERLRDRWPGVAIRIRPLSLTSGVHMGPGTWGIAYLTDTTKEPHDRRSS